MPDYKKGMIYKIVNNENNKVYYGSTCQPLHKRMYDHRSKHSKCMSKNLGVDLKECKIILVEKIECDCKYELEKRERFYIENNECVNKYIPTRTKKEWCEANKQKIAEKDKKNYEKNKEKILKRKKEYYENNKEIIKEQQKQHYKKNKEKAKEYKQKNKEHILEQKKQYYEKNKQKINEYAKQYQQKNKDKISEKAKEKMTCECGSVIRKADKIKHFKTKKHQKFICNPC